MSAIVFKTLDFSGIIGGKIFREVLRELGFPHPSLNGIHLNLNQLRSLIGVLFTYGLHYDEVNEKQRTILLWAIVEDKQPLFNISKTFSGHLLNNLEDPSRLEFRELQKIEYNLNDLLSNERLMDFVETELIDPTVSMRKWEYGRYSIANISEHFLEGIDWEKTATVIDAKHIRLEDYLRNIGDKLEKVGESLAAHERTLLQLTVKARLWPQKTTLADYLMAGSIVQSHLIGLSIRKEKLQKSLSSALETGRSKRKGRGGHNP